MVDVTPRLSLTLAEGAQFPQPVPKVSFLAFGQLSGPPLDLLLFISVFSLLEQPKLDTIFTCSLESAEQRGTILSHYTLAVCSCDTGQDTVGLLCCQDTLLAYTQLAVQQDPQVVFSRVALQSVSI